MQLSPPKEKTVVICDQDGTGVYFGQLFKRRTGKYFHDFVNEVRIENALRFLREGHLSMNEISCRGHYDLCEYLERPGMYCNHIYICYCMNRPRIIPSSFCLELFIADLLNPQAISVIIKAIHEHFNRRIPCGK